MGLSHRSPLSKDDFVYADGKLVTVWALNGKEVPANTPGAKEMNKLKDPNGVYQDYFQTGTIKFGPGDVKYKDVNGDGKIDGGSRSVGTVTDEMIRITVNVIRGTWKLLVTLHRVTNMVSVWVPTIKALISLSLCRV